MNRMYVASFLPVLNKKVLSIGYHVNNYRIRYDKEGKNSVYLKEGGISNNYVQKLLPCQFTNQPKFEILEQEYLKAKERQIGYRPRILIFAFNTYSFFGKSTTLY